MSSAVLNPSYIPAEHEAKQALNRPGLDAPEKRKLALVIPTLCEAENIAGLIDQIRTVLDPLAIPYEILVVDDDSSDGTGRVVSTLARQDHRVRLLVRRGQRGLSGAILHGWRHSDASILGVMDADLQHPPELLPELLAAIEKDRDIVIGSRYATGGKLGRWNPVRKLISSAAIWITWPIQRSRVRAKDSMSGYFMVRRHCLDRVQFQESGFKLLLEILVRGRIQSLAEIPFAFGLRSRGASKANIKVAMDFARLVIRLYVSNLGKRRRIS